MPVYEYLCPHCKRVFELMRPMSESDEPASCPECKAVSPKLISVFASTAEGTLKIPDKDALREN